MNLLTYLNQPFPKLESRWKLIILISLFVALFLIIFQPFGINLMKSNHKIIVLSGYGLVTFIALFINIILIENIFPKLFDERNWKIWKEFLWLMWVIFSIGLGNAFYTDYLINYLDSGFQFFLTFQFFTLVIGLIPVSILIITKQKYLLKKFIISANDLNKSIDHEKSEIHDSKIIQFFADNEKDSVSFSSADFYFIESSGNYVEISFLKDAKIVRKTYRSTLKRALDFFNNTPEVIQCHRAFIVNTAKIIKIQGNSQGLRLNLENCDTEVPVSRGFVNSVRNKIG